MSGGYTEIAACPWRGLLSSSEMEPKRDLTRIPRRLFFTGVISLIKAWHRRFHLADEKRKMFNVPHPPNSPFSLPPHLVPSLTPFVLSLFSLLLLVLIILIFPLLVSLSPPRFSPTPPSSPFHFLLPLFLLLPTLSFHSLPLPSLPRSTLPLQAKQNPVLSICLVSGLTRRIPRLPVRPSRWHSGGLLPSAADSPHCSPRESAVIRPHWYYARSLCKTSSPLNIVHFPSVIFTFLSASSFMLIC